MSTQVFSITAGADDQRIYRNGNSYPPTGTFTRDTSSELTMPQRAFVSGGVPPAAISNSLLRWDTSSIPDGAVPQSASLDLVGWNFKSDANSRSVVGEYYNWDGVNTTDWAQDAPTTGLAFSKTIASWNATGNNSIPLTNLSGINKTGYTSLRLHISGGTPTDQNYVDIATYEHATKTEPRLTVTYDDLFWTYRTPSGSPKADDPHDASIRRNDAGLRSRLRRRRSSTGLAHGHERDALRQRVQPSLSGLRAGLLQLECGALPCHPVQGQVSLERQPRRIRTLLSRNHLHRRWGCVNGPKKRTIGG